MSEVVLEAMTNQVDMPTFDRSHHLAYCAFLLGVMEQSDRQIAEMTEIIDRDSRLSAEWPAARQRVETAIQTKAVHARRRADAETALCWANEYAQCA